MLVGEIGVPRRDFLYDIRFWEARRIIKGYVRRDRIMKEMQRLTAFCTYFSMRNNDEQLQPHQWLTLPWEVAEKDTDPSTLPTDEEIERMRRLMAEENAKAKSKPAP